MAKKLLAVDGFSYSISDPTVQATISLIGVPSLKVRAESKGVCKDGFSLVVSAIKVPSVGATTPDPVPYTVSFSATSTKNKVEGSFPLRVDDETSTINANPIIPGTPPAPYPVSFNIKITNSGQSKVKGE